jgi:hypothetical protein
VVLGVLWYLFVELLLLIILFVPLVCFFLPNRFLIQVGGGDLETLESDLQSY